jgi:hypothetical protein
LADWAAAEAAILEDRSTETGSNRGDRKKAAMAFIVIRSALFRSTVIRKVRNVFASRIDN